MSRQADLTAVTGEHNSVATAGAYVGARYHAAAAKPERSEQSLQQPFPGSSDTKTRSDASSAGVVETLEHRRFTEFCDACKRCNTSALFRPSWCRQDCVSAALCKTSDARSLTTARRREKIHVRSLVDAQTTRGE